MTVIRSVDEEDIATSTTADVIDIVDQDISVDETDIARKDSTACSGLVAKPFQKDH